MDKIAIEQESYDFTVTFEELIASQVAKAALPVGTGEQL